MEFSYTGMISVPFYLFFIDTVHTPEGRQFQGASKNQSSGPQDVSEAEYFARVNTSPNFATLGDIRGQGGEAAVLVLRLQPSTLG